MSRESNTLNLDKKTTIGVGFLIVLIPAIFYVASVFASVAELETRVNRQSETLQRIDERTRQIQIDVQDIKSRSN